MKSLIVSESLIEWYQIKEMELVGHQLAKAIEKDKKLNEAIALLTLGAILAAPTFLKILGMLIKKGSKLFKYKGGEKTGEKLKQFAQKTENKFLKPIIFVLKRFGVKEDKAKKWAIAIHALIVILLGVASGLETVHAFKAAHISKSSFEGMLTALKGTETGENIIKYVQTAAKAAKAIK